MGFWKRIYGSPPRTIEHPVLGQMSWQPPSTWHVGEVAPLGCRGKPPLSIEGDEDGLAPECLRTYEKPRHDWSRIGAVVAEDIFELNQNYFIDEPEHAMRSADEVLKEQ